MHGRSVVANATRKPRALLRARLSAAHVPRRGRARYGVLGSLHACNGQTRACHGGAPAMASLRGGLLARVFLSLGGSARPRLCLCLCESECTCVCVLCIMIKKTVGPWAS
ncbi:hypothetical protein BDA96_02G447300 [Sorghum bicolor]|uniref:Uncharacterized protein n=2 Tax=Sorghum bicolor TaxID=4558 RepID=A0A921RUL6_SORBI|nr:hypothetical protein BDA96_02G447300 [Sorghum bicolor]KXG37017.1 hypothetical protein SORBI_3002G427000 [Sorghum bicolor]